MTGPNDSPRPRYRLGVDVGGTFTDIVLTHAEDGTVYTGKVPSDAARPASAVVDGVAGSLARHGVAPEDVEHFAHGQTFALNTVLQRAGARTGLLVTSGFPDLLEIGRLRLRDPIDFFAAPQRPLVERADVREVGERLRADGTVERPLDEAGLLAAADSLVADGVQALAVSFVHAHAYPEHERRAVGLLRAAYPGLVVAGAAELWPEEKEYERTTVAVLAAHVAAQLAGYLGELSTRLRALGLRCPLYITKSNGGVMSLDTGTTEILRAAVETLLSGPAAGVAGAVRLARAAGVDRLITMDMGGTSVDTALVEGDIPYSTDSALGDFPLIIPSVEVSSIGAGGGSVARLDASGVLKVGPRSAGAVPGPAAYGRGGTEPTLTDAYVVCGYLDPEDFAGGAVTLDTAAAHASLRPLAERLGLTVEQAAAATIDVATAMMHAQLVPLLARRGIDATGSRLVAYGGAGPVHAALLARSLNIRHVLVPWSPGTLCAFGALATDLRQDLVTSVGETTATLDDGRLERGWKDLSEQALAWYARQSSALYGPPRLRRWADVQLLGQSFTLPVVLPDDWPPTAGSLRTLFADAYRVAYGVDATGSELDVRNLRVTLTAPADLPLPTAVAAGSPRPPRAHTVHESGERRRALRRRRADLPTDTVVHGPVVISAPDTTVYVPTGATARADSLGNLLIDVEAKEGS
ncbi:hydantoinase/oxoprolinase family protein [Streptomyces scopuliridis]|uniref:hydantoinase/oxoprolinase family protein n=1 Tax=Streptomyces scopuliridis TaxID=452529 RepID=UPI003697B9DC